MIALADCNSFYASCERVFDPRLRGYPWSALSESARQGLEFLTIQRGWRG